MTSLDEKRDPKSSRRGPEELKDIRNTAITGEISEFAVVAEGEERTTWFVWLLVCCCTISGLLFGKCIDVKLDSIY
jgi:SP family myo-inositol transporter-like MFS transporter 13